MVAASKADRVDPKAARTVRTARKVVARAEAAHVPAANAAADTAVNNRFLN
jgi:hypothetical protein